MSDDQREAIVQAIREAIMNEPSLLHPLDTFDANAIIRLVLPLVAEAEQRGYANGLAEGKAADETLVQACIRDAEQRGYERGRVNAPRVVYENGYRAALEEARAKIKERWVFDDNLIMRSHLLALFDELRGE